MTSKFLITLCAAALLSACGGKTDDAKSHTDSHHHAETSGDAVPTVKAAGVDVSDALIAALSAQDENTKARYQARHPGNTLAFFEIEPGMTVAEALPGGGWYSKILLDYLGADGELIGVDYAFEMWPNFSFMTPERIKAKETWPVDWVVGAQEWRDENSAKVSATTFSSVPAGTNGKVDAVLFVRALHNLSRFEDNGGYLSEAARVSYDMLKPGGIVGVVQHRAPELNADDWANGSNGYLKESFVIKTFEDAGFTLVARSEMNANALDRPTENDIVWRLPPSLATTGPSDADDEETASKKAVTRAKLQAVGESDRMTLKFKKN